MDPMFRRSLFLKDQTIAELRKKNSELVRELADYEATFDLRQRADARAIVAWRAKHPERELKSPDHVDLIVWLADECERLRLDNERLKDSVQSE